MACARILLVFGCFGTGPAGVRVFRNRTKALFFMGSKGDVKEFLLGLSCFGSAPNGGRSCHRSCHCSSIHYMVFAWFFHAFEAACLVMSGIGVGLSSSFLWASEGDVRQFFGGWFLDRLGLNPAGVGLFRLRAERRPELPPKLPLQLHPQLHPLHGFCMVFSCFRSCLSGDVRHWRWPFFIFLVGVRRRR